MKFFSEKSSFMIFPESRNSVLIGNESRPMDCHWQSSPPNQQI